jgi:hypothetical protein
MTPERAISLLIFVVIAIILIFVLVAVAERLG